MSGHGTAVAGIAAGSGLEGDGRYKGVAWESDLLIVKLGVPATDSFPRTTEMMRALDYVVNRAVFTRNRWLSISASVIHMALTMEPACWKLI